MAQSWKKAKRVVGSNPGQESAALDREGFPELSAFLGGVPTADGRAFDLAPHSFTLWIEGDMLHWCCQSKQEPNKLFGSVSSMSDLSGALEKALESEAFSVRKRDK